MLVLLQLGFNVLQRVRLNQKSLVIKYFVLDHEAGAASERKKKRERKMRAHMLALVGQKRLLT